MLFSAADLALVAVVTSMATATAYLRSPRAKSLAYMLPLPFSAGFLASGQPVDATHVAGVAMVWAYPWLVWGLHARMRVNILLADLLALVAYLGAGLLLADVLPAGGPGQAVPFWAALAVLTALGGLLLPIRPRSEPGHRSPMSPWMKVPAILFIVLGIVLLKEPLRGFMPSFPYVTIFAVYEARRSLHTLAARMPVFVLGIAPLMAFCRLLEPAHGPFTALLAGWAVYLPVYAALDALYRRRTSASPPAAQAGA